MFFMKKFILLFLSIFLFLLQVIAGEFVDSGKIYKKYNKEVQRRIQNLPKINEAAMGNHHLVVRYKNNNDEK